MILYNLEHMVFANLWLMLRTNVVEYLCNSLFALSSTRHIFSMTPIKLTKIKLSIAMNLLLETC